MNVPEIRALSKRFGNLRALQGVTLSVAAREPHAVIAANGAGNAPLFNVLRGLSAPTVVFDPAGRITVLDQGTVLAEERPEQIAANAAVQAASVGEAA